METRIGRALLSGDVADGDTIRVDSADDQLVVRWDKAAHTDRTAA
jgi:ATP-dependent Clp protease ATP-binding subunit ClpB